MTRLTSSSDEWFRRAAQVIPGGVYGHTSPVLSVAGAYPAFAQDARGSRYRDMDGNEYIDFMCGYGPVILGHGDEEVEAAVTRAREKGSCLNHPTPLLVELAERLVERIDFGAWAVMGKNGSDLTTWGVRVAREHTRRRLVLKVQGAYHGMHAWCAPGQGGVIPEDRAQVMELPWNDADALEDAYRRNRDRVAALILTPFHHPAYGDSELPSSEFVYAANRLTRRAGALLVLDDVRCGLRLGEIGSHGAFGFEPDLAIYGKALANGHAISAAVGHADLRPSASRVFLTGSFWNDPAPMAAALVTLERTRRQQLHLRLEAAGRRFVEGLHKLARSHGIELVASGPPSMPYVRMAQDPSLQRTREFSVAALSRGVFLHPHHNWFLCDSHSDAEIDEALVRLDGAFQDLARSDQRPGA